MDKPLWGLRVLKFDGAIAPRVLKFDSGFAAEGYGGAPLIYRWCPLMIKPLQPGFCPKKTGQPRFARGNAFPLWWLAPPPFPRKRWHYKAPLCCELLMKGLLFRALFCPRLQGEVRRSRIGGGERSEPIGRMLIIPYDIESQSRNADFILIARRAIPPPFEPSEPFEPFEPSRRRRVRGRSPVNPHTAGVSHEPSHRRRVQSPTT